jgi:hypothetical protein
MEEQTQDNPASKDHMTQSLIRLRKKLTYEQDTMNCTSFAIRALEYDLAQLEENDEVANA